MFYSASAQLRALFELADCSSRPATPSVWDPPSSAVRENRSACFTVGIPGLPDEIMLRWLGPRVVYWPEGMVEPTWTAVASSRLARPLDEQREWFARLRRVGDELRSSDASMLVVANTFVARFARHLARRYAIPRVELEVADDASSLAQWLRTMFALPPPARDERVRDERSITTTRLFLSPVLEPQYVATSDGRVAVGNRVVCSEVPAADRAVVGLSDRLSVLAVRPNGQLARLLDARQDESARPPARFVDPSPLESACAVESSSERNERNHVPASPQNRPLSSSKEKPPPHIPWPALCHCTRRHDGPWADQTEDAFLDELLYDRPEKDRSARAVLERIIASRRLCGSSAAIRGGYRVVGFTSVELDELPSLHVYQKHRHRWDFEPYGLCIRRAWLEQRGARPVQYGDEACWKRLAPAERPFFQAAARGRRLPTRRLSTREPNGWQHEREWRVLGDVDLSQLPPDACCVFVATEDDARRLRKLSPWPVVLVAGDDHP